MTGSQNEDIEQEVYIRTWKNLDKYKETGRFKSWITVIAANLCRDYIKSSYFRKARSVITDDDELVKIKDEKQNVEFQLLQKQRQKRIINAINSLKPKLKQVIVMYEIQGMSCEEISEKLKCPAGTVKSRLFNARKELSVILEDLI